MKYPSTNDYSYSFLFFSFLASKVNLAVHEDKNKSVYVKGATER